MSRADSITGGVATDDSGEGARPEQRASRKRAHDAPDTKRGRPRAEPWNVGSLVPWSVIAAFGDPVLLLAPVAATVFGIIAVLGIGAGGSCVAGGAPVPGCPAHVVVPLWSLPPFDAFQDAGAVDLATSKTPLVWALRAAALVGRAAFFGTMAHVALQRAYDRAPETKPAAAAVRSRWRSFVVLELVSFAVFGVPLLLGQGSILEAGRPVSQVGALAGQVLLINAFFAAFAEPGPGRALVAGLRWMRRKPLGHLALAILATAGSNGVYWLATAGEAGRPRDLTVGLYALVHAVLTTVFLVAFARRWALLYAPGPAPRRPVRRRKRSQPRRWPETGSG